MKTRTFRLWAIALAAVTTACTVGHLVFEVVPMFN